MNDPRTNAGSIDVRSLRTKTSFWRNNGISILAGAGVGAAVALIGIPALIHLADKQLSAIGQDLIQREIRKSPIDPGNKDIRQVTIKLAQCQSQLDDFANRLATVGAAVDLGD